jgi:hypothetical protein
MVLPFVENYIMIIHGNIPKSKKRKVSQAKKHQYEQWLLSISSMSTNFSRNKSTKFSKQIPMFMVPAGRESPPIVSLDTGFIACTKKFGNSYTGDKIKGIGTMHKSNAVPVFSDNEAKDIASMRR